MIVADAIAHVPKKEGVDVLFAYPVNTIIETAARADIRTVSAVKSESVFIWQMRIRDYQAERRLERFVCNTSREPEMRSGALHKRIPNRRRSWSCQLATHVD